MSGYWRTLTLGSASLAKLTGGAVYPEVYVTFRAEYLWREGHVGAVRQFEGWLGTWAVIKGERVSRCDLCMDIQMELPEIDLTQRRLHGPGVRLSTTSHVRVTPAVGERQATE